jgi:hypothetical protein
VYFSTNEKALMHMLTPTHFAAVLATAGVVAAIALTPTASSNAANTKSGPKHPDISARHGHPIR